MKNSGPTRDARGRVRGGNPGNSGGKKGRSGRPPQVWKDFCKKAIEDPTVQAGILKRAQTGDPAMIRVLAEHGMGMPEQPVRVPGPDALELFLSHLARLRAEEEAGCLSINGGQTSECVAWGLAPLRLSPSSEAGDRCDE